MSLVSLFYAKIYINIVVSKEITTIYVEMKAGKGKVITQIETFDGVEINRLMTNFIDSFTRESPNVFVSILDYSFDQGAVASCSASAIRSQVGNVASVCYENRWSFYTASKNIETLKKRYESIGVDFIFSPFAMLAQFFKDKIETESAIFILVQEASQTIMIFGESKLLYAQHIDTQDSRNETLLIDTIQIDDEIMLNIDEGEQEQGLDNFADIEDLDIGGSINEFASNTKIASKESAAVGHATLIPSGMNYQRFTMIQNALDIFYKNANYESIFIETAYLADATATASELQNYLEEEMFMTVFVRKIDILKTLCDFAKAEK